jgi:hypothetical protein
MTFQRAKKYVLKNLCIAIFAFYGASAFAAEAGPQAQPDLSSRNVMFSYIKGQYEFASGRLLTLTGSEHRIRAQLDDHPEVIMVRTENSALEAVDGSFKLTFRQYPNGTVTTVDLEETLKTKVNSDPAPKYPDR